MGRRRGLRPGIHQYTRMATKADTANRDLQDLCQKGLIACDDETRLSLAIRALGKAGL